MPITRHFTVADLATMSDDGLRYEVVRGELLVTPSAQAPEIEREQLVWRHPALDDECVIDLVKLFDFG